MIICYTVPEIWCVTDVIVIFHFGIFFALFGLYLDKAVIRLQLYGNKLLPVVFLLCDYFMPLIQVLGKTEVDTKS